MIDFTLNELKLLRMALRLQEDDPSEEDFEFIDNLGEEKVVKIMEKAVSKINRIIEIKVRRIKK